MSAVRSDEQLIQSCRGGDATAWSELIGRYQKLIYFVVQRYRLPAGEEADVFQGVCLDLYRSLSSIQQAGALRGWLITATMRRCLLHKRRIARVAELSTSAELDEPSVSPDPMAVREEAEQLQALEEAIRELPDRCQRLVRMLFFEQPPVPYAQVAARLGLALGSIGFTRASCLAKLRKLLEQKQGLA